MLSNENTVPTIYAVSNTIIFYKNMVPNEN